MDTIGTHLFVLCRDPYKRQMGAWGSPLSEVISYRVCILEYINFGVSFSSFGVSFITGFTIAV